MGQKIIERYKVLIKTQTPIHIGSGECLQPHEYVFSKDLFKVYVIDEFAYRKLDKIKRDMLITRIKRTRELTSDLIYEFYSGLSDREKESIAKFVILNPFKINPMTENITKWIFLNIRDSIKKQVYIPGSSLKGAVETLIISHLFQTLPQDDKQRIEKTIESEIKHRIPVNVFTNDQKKIDFARSEYRDSVAKLSKILGTLIINIFFKRIGANQKRDFMYLSKLFGFRDTTTCSESKLYKIVIVDHPAHKETQTKRTVVPVEVIDKGVTLETEFFLSLKPDVLKSIRLNSNVRPFLNYVSNKKFDEKILSLLTWDSIRAMSISIMKALIDREISFLKEIKENFLDEFRKNYESVYRFYQNLKNEINKLSENQMILRVGFASGFRFTTITSLLSPSLQNTIIRLFAPKLVEPARSNPSYFPISRRLANNNRENIPLGWVKLEKIE
ncbi:MAG: type III-A CRISPR-associated RAMP protein Csm5 [Candidatus Odinarchaeota archaeon]|nr:type III-A CRISPR-associated RAMP protein Csm5 [Candidatus Odinarchaeota archaeon]